MNFLFFFCRKSIFRILAHGWAPILGSRFQRVEYGKTSKELVVKVGNGTKKSKLEKVTLDKPRGRDVAGFCSKDLIFEIFGPKIAKNQGFHLRGYFGFLGQKAP